MGRRRGRLQRKLSVSLFCVLLSVTTVGTVILYFVGFRLIAKANSLAAMPIVQSLAEELSEEPTYDAMRFLQRSQKTIGLLPGLKLYLVNDEGTLLADLSTEASGVDLPHIDPKPIQAFVNEVFWKGDPRYVDNPAQEGHRGLFVASRTVVEGKQLYLLAILDGTIGWTTFDAGLDRYLLPYAFTVIVVLLIISCLSLSCIYFVFTRRLRKLMGLIQQYEAGNFSAKVSLSGDDELNQLAENAHSMAHRIERQILEISERDEVRRDLIAGVSHDLRAPVSTLKFEAETLSHLPIVQQDPILSEKTKKLERVIGSLGTLLSQLFELAKLETQDSKAHLTAYPIGALIAEMSERYQETAKRSGLQLIAEDIDEVSEVLCDPSLVERVLTNLIENALTYTLEGGIVTLSTAPTLNGLRISVSDSGVGIADDEQDLVFQRSYRASRWESRRKSSAGLGLAIVKKLIETQGSSVQLVSEEGKGSCFSFILPFASKKPALSAQ